MRFIVIIVFIFLVCLNLKSQDSIYFRNKSVIAVKIDLITKESVTYKLFNSGSNVNYIVNKDDILKIKYQNGFIEEFKITPIEEKVKNIFVQNVSEKIDYKTVAKNTNNLFLFIDERKKSDNKKELSLIAIEIQKNYQHKRATGTCVPIFAAFTGASFLVLSLDYLITFGNPNKEVFYPPIGFGILCVGSVVGNVIFTNKLRTSRLKFVDLYNQ